MTPQDVKEIKIVPTATWLPLITVVSICVTVFAISWWARGLESQVEAQGKTLVEFKDETRRSLAEIKEEIKKKPMLGSEEQKKTGGYDDNPISLNQTPPPAQQIPQTPSQAPVVSTEPPLPVTVELTPPLIPHLSLPSLKL